MRLPGSTHPFNVPEGSSSSGRERGREIHQDGLLDLTSDIRGLIQEVAKERQRLAEMAGGTLGELDAKRELLQELSERLSDISTNADLLVAATLANASKGRVGLDIGSKLAVTAARQHATGKEAQVDRVEDARREWLDNDLPPGRMPREPFHWPLAFPEIFVDGGFDAIVGNPPFLGGKKISGSSGSAYRDYLIEAIGDGVKGNADLVAYFVLRAIKLLNSSGQTGLLATNTLAQGDTREVGLDQISAGGSEIRRAIKSAPWPSRSAVLEYCAIWTSSTQLGSGVSCMLDGREVRRITPSLDAESRIVGQPHRLPGQSRISFIGSFVLGSGFVLEPEAAAAMIRRDPRNAEVLFPFLNGQDLNNRPDFSASRWVIEFHDWTDQRAATHLEPWRIVQAKVRPERQRTKADGSFVLRSPLPHRYWQYADKRPAMIRAITGLRRVIVITLVSKVVMPIMVSTGQVFSHKLGIFATDDTAILALLSSAPHYWWAITRSSTMKADLNYSPSDVFETFARPESSIEMRRHGDTLDTFRRELMLSRQAGLTATYNMVHDSSCADADIVKLRAIHQDIDQAVCAAYGWADLVNAGLDHGFHDTRQGVRYTVGPLVRQEILDRLLELNHERYAAEQAAGKPSKGRPRASRGAQGELFG